MSVETLVETAPAPNLNTVERELASQRSSRLGPPFYSPWQTFQGPKPHGFFCKTQLDSYRGTMRAEMGAEPHPADAPLTIGWCWWGWKRSVYAPFPGFLFASVHADDVVVNHNGGNWVPKASISLRQGSRLIAEDIQNLYRGQTTLVRLFVPAPGNYELQVGGSVRAVYRGSASPYGLVEATVSGVLYGFGRTLGEGVERSAERPEGDFLPIGLELDEPTAEEIRAEFAKLGETTGRELGSVDGVREAGLVEV